MKCEICHLPIETGDTKVVEHTWTTDTYRHQDAEHCINALVTKLEALRIINWDE